VECLHTDTQLDFVVRYAHADSGRLAWEGSGVHIQTAITLLEEKIGIKMGRAQYLRLHLTVPSTAAWKSVALRCFNQILCHMYRYRIMWLTNWWTIAYVIHRYKAQAAQSVQLFAFTRQSLSFTVGFWSILFGEEGEFQWSGHTYALFLILFYVPTVVLTMKYGERVRAVMGKPN
jgi:hypothetical protein